MDISHKSASKPKCHHPYEVIADKIWLSLMVMASLMLSFMDMESFMW